VRYVVISGNKNTREHVIRREISIHEGDRFQRSALVRTQGDIFRLGIFEDVGIDFSPAESTDVDIQLKVKEKQVGTASAGAGYTAESGVTGFLELGHNNVLGNAQTLQLHLERGGRRSDYSLGFTEPWFRGTPTLLGINLFNSTRDRDVYSEQRVGGSVRVGRPLPWPDYTRGTLAYAMENVTLDSLGFLTPADRIALRGLSLGTATLTSSVELNLTRNNTNNPFYPTKGSRLMINNQFAGGVIGGAVDFDKLRLEGRLYLHGLLPFMTTMVRARFGFLMPVESGKPVPEYERFRLGGGTTVDPLRGYDDYQVVPPKYIVRAPIAYRPDTVISAPGDTTITQVPFAWQTVRYPGGRFMAVYTVEQQFPIVAPLRGVIFFDAGNTWDMPNEVNPHDLLMGAGGGLRMEIPLLGNVGFDYGYGFDRDDRPKWVGYLLIGNVNF
jgi:outer membrane protein insertion porin family